MALTMSNREAFGRALVKLGGVDPRVVVLDADVCTSTRTALFREAFPERFIQIGVAEQHLMSAAAGMSTVGGLVPWVSTFGVFAAGRALEQVSISIAYPRLNVKINGSYAGVPTGSAGATHQAMTDIAAMRALPGMTVIDPLDAVEVEAAVFAATALEGPVYLRTTRHETRVLLDAASCRFELGKAVKLLDGDALTIVGTGPMSVLAWDAARLLADEGIRARVLHIHTIKPIDEEAIVAAARQTAGFVTVENHSVIGGLGSAVCEVVARHWPARVLRIGFPDVYGESGEDGAVFRKLGISVEHVAAAARALLAG